MISPRTFPPSGRDWRDRCKGPNGKHRHADECVPALASSLTRLSHEPGCHSEAALHRHKHRFDITRSGDREVQTSKVRTTRCGSSALSLRKRTVFFQWPLPSNVGRTMGGYRHTWRQIFDAKHGEPQRSRLRRQYCAAGNQTLERHSSFARIQRAVHQCRELAINRGNKMKATQILHELGQSLWLDNITRDLLDSGTLKHYIDDLRRRSRTATSK